MSVTNIESHEEAAICRGERRDLEEPLSFGTLEQSQTALDAACVPVRSASDLGIDTSGS